MSNCQYSFYLYSKSAERLYSKLTNIKMGWNNRNILRPTKLYNYQSNPDKNVLSNCNICGFFPEKIIRKEIDNLNQINRAFFLWYNYLLYSYLVPCWGIPMPSTSTSIQMMYLHTICGNYMLYHYRVKEQGMHHINMWSNNSKNTRWRRSRFVGTLKGRIIRLLHICATYRVLGVIR